MNDFCKQLYKRVLVTILSTCYVSVLAPLITYYMVSNANCNIPDEIYFRVLRGTNVLYSVVCVASEIIVITAVIITLIIDKCRFNRQRHQVVMVLISAGIYVACFGFYQILESIEILQLDKNTSNCPDITDNIKWHSIIASVVTVILSVICSIYLAVICVIKVDPPDPELL